MKEFYGEWKAFFSLVPNIDYERETSTAGHYFLEETNNAICGFTPKNQDNLGPAAHGYKGNCKKCLKKLDELHGVVKFKQTGYIPSWQR